MSAFTNEVIGPLTDTELRAVPVPVSGSVSVSNFPATQNVNVTGTVETEIKNDSGNPIPVVIGVSAAASTTQVTSNSANQTLLAANVNRKKLILFFLNGVWDVKLGATASAISRLMRISSSNYYLEITGYTGQVDAICTTSGKFVDATELV